MMDHIRAHSTHIAPRIPPRDSRFLPTGARDPCRGLQERKRKKPRRKDVPPCCRAEFPLPGAGEADGRGRRLMTEPPRATRVPSALCRGDNRYDRTSPSTSASHLFAPGHRHCRFYDTGERQRDRSPSSYSCRDTHRSSRPAHGRYMCTFDYGEDDGWQSAVTD